MITPSFALTATERVLPRMALDFTTASLDSRVTFTRSGNTATVTNSSGVIAAINANLPRFDFDPTTLVCKGLLIEETRTNLLLNSLIDGTSLSTQLVTTTAVAQTLSFYGTGQIVLTGTSSATVVGTGAYPSRKTLTFTPTAGVLTLTVTGTVQYAQLEVGSFATSFIPTDATSKTRNADVATMTGTNFSDWYVQGSGTAAVEVDWIGSVITGFPSSFEITDGTSNNWIGMSSNSGLNARIGIRTGAAGQVDQIAGSVGNPMQPNAVVKYNIGYSTNNSNGGAVGTINLNDTTCTIPVVMTQARIGSSVWISSWNGHIRKVQYYPQRLTNAELTAISK